MTTTPTSSEAPVPGDREVRGDTLVLGLTFSLLAFLYVFVTVVSIHLDPDDVRLLVPGVARLTHSAFAGMALMVAVAAYHRGRDGWWLYAVGAVVPLVQWGVLWVWFRHTRHEPVTWRRWTL